MTTELKFLAASIILGLVHLVAASHLISFQYGYRWTASNREEPVPPLRGLANRIDQATTNFLETFAFFAALVLAICLTHRQSRLSIWGVNLYLWGTMRLPARGNSGLWIAALAALLEHGACWNRLLTHSAARIKRMEQSIRMTAVAASLSQRPISKRLEQSHRTRNGFVPKGLFSLPLSGYEISELTLGEDA